MLRVLLIFIFCLQCFAIEGVYEVIIRKQEQKQQRRWTLTDWLITKKKIALQDQWLALHSSDDYFEFYITGAQGDLEHSTNGVIDPIKHTALRYGAGMYVRFFGLEYQRDKFHTQIENEMYQASLMIFGSSIQTSSLGGFGGVRQMRYSSTQKFKQPYFGGWLQLYLLSFLGVKGQYMAFNERESEQGGSFMESSRTELTGFIEIYALRLYATAFSEKFEFRNSTEKKIEGTLFGATLYF